MKIHFILICEGQSDEALIPHLRSLLVSCGAREATGVAPDFRRLPESVPRDVQSKVRTAVQLEKHIDLLFIHRDADSRNPEPRYSEISNGVADARYSGRWIGVVPVQETEAWLLLDEMAIRRVSGKPSGQVELNLPIPNHAETVLNPKERLSEELLRASESTGRRRALKKKKLSSLRRQLLTQLKVGGSLNSVPSWIRLKDDIIRYIQEQAHQ